MNPPRKPAHLQPVRYVIRSTVTGQWLTGWADDTLTGKGPESLPVWGDQSQALVFTPVEAATTVQRIRTEHGIPCKTARV